MAILSTLYLCNTQSSNSCRLEVAIIKNLRFPSKFVCRHRVGNQQPNEFYLNSFVCKKKKKETQNQKFLNSPF